MKHGYTPTEAYQMFRSLRKEVFGFFNYDKPLTFGVRPESQGIFAPGAIAHVDFSADPETPSYRGERIMEHAVGLRFNATYLPHLWEDEMLNIFLHELTHATAGWDFVGGHGIKWQDHARQVGAIPSPLFVPRNWKDCWPEGHWLHEDTRHYVNIHGGATLDIFAGSL